MPRLPRITARKLVQTLCKNLFYIHHITGSHANLRHKIKNDLRVVVPIHSGELAPKTVKTILVQAEMTVGELIDLL
jgi:predicted RNA binding protein YcfA (HicA-like mRNA interferase family)